MTWDNYIQAFEDVLNGKNLTTPYDDPVFVNIVKLNYSRMNRWLKKGMLFSDTIEKIECIQKKQKWILITEPWCGDAAHIAPFIQSMAALNSNITLEIQLRDSKESEIETYLTNGAKAMPKLIVRNSLNEDLFTWGPRTADCAEFVLQQRETNLTAEQKKAEQQVWYNENKGVSIQRELTALLNARNDH